MENFKVAVIPGDGIGVEVTEEAVRVMDKVCGKYDVKLEYSYLKAGGCAIDEYGIPLTEEVLEECKRNDAVFLGAVGGPKWDNLPGSKRPEQALLGLRKGLGLFANLRPTKVYDELKAASPLKDSIIDKGVDILVVRELTGGIYFGERGRKEVEGVPAAYDTLEYNVDEIKRITYTAFKAAMKRNKKLTLVDKANILESSRLWREVVDEISKEYPQVDVNQMYVDNAAMQLVRDPSQFDVILTSNMFGDILSDEASMISGSIGMLASSSLRDDNFGMYEPIHGSAPDIAGKNLANPLAQILSAAMMLEYTFNMSEAAGEIEKAVEEVLKEGYRTGDIYTDGMKKVGTREMGKLVLERL